MTERPPESVAAAPRSGERFVLTRDVDRSPHFIAPRGSGGAVTDVSDGVVCLRLNQALPGAKEWDDEIVWDREWNQDFWADVEVER